VVLSPHRASSRGAGFFFCPQIFQTNHARLFQPRYFQSHHLCLALCIAWLHIGCDGLALAPIGAYIAITGVFDILPVVYGLIVLLWVAGFDIIYALQDEVFDREQALNSIPTRFGGSRALRLSRLLHLICIALLSYVSWSLFNQHPNAWIPITLSWVLFAGALVYQQSLVSEGDLSRVGRAFFTTNGVASIAYASLVICGILLLG